MLSCWRKKLEVCSGVLCKVVDAVDGRVIEVDSDGHSERFLRHTPGYGMVSRFFALDTNCCLKLRKLKVLRNQGQLSKALWVSTEEKDFQIWPRLEVNLKTCGSEKERETKQPSLLSDILKGFNATFDSTSKKKEIKRDGESVHDEDSRSEASAWNDVHHMAKKKKQVLSNHVHCRLCAFKIISFGFASLSIWCLGPHMVW